MIGFEIGGGLLIALGVLYGAAPRIAAATEPAQPGRHRGSGRQTRAAARRLRETDQQVSA